MSGSLGLRPDAAPEVKARILLVDDNPANLLGIRSILDDLDHTLMTAHSGEEALRQLQSDDFAVVLLDVHMPGIDGFETARLIRKQERSKHTPIIFQTAHDIDRRQLEQGYALGVVDFLMKPLVPVILKAKVNAFVELFKEKERTKREANLLRLLIHGTIDYAIFLLDPEGRVVTWNAGAERIKGYRAEEIIGQHFSRFYTKEAVESGWPAHELDVAKKEGRFEDEGWRIRKDGRRFWANVVITALRDEAGNLQGFSKLTRDMTEKKQAEENARQLLREESARRTAETLAHAIQQERERLRVTLASIGDAVISTDDQGQVTFLNPIAERLTGWTQAEAIGKPLVDVFRIINEFTREPVENPAVRSLKEGVIVGLANHTVLIGKNATERPIDDSAAPIKDERGTILGVVLVFRDVTERRRADEALRESEARKTAILRTALDCVITMDHEGKVVEFNPAAEKTFGYSREQVIGRELAGLIIPPALRERHHNGMARYLATGEQRVLNQRLELPALRADGTEFPVELAIARISSVGPPLFTAYLRDISERARIERHRNARLAVTQVLAQASTIQEAAPGILQTICESLGWDVGFFWALSREEQVLQCLESWHKPGVTVAEFEAASRKHKFEKGMGLPGHVWATGRPAGVLDFTNETKFPRVAIAAREGLHGAFGCPLLVGTETLGVIEFFSRQVRPPDTDLLEMMDTVSGQIGQFMERQRAEEEVRFQARLLDTVGQAAIVTDPDGTIIFWNRFAETLYGWTKSEALGRNLIETVVASASVAEANEIMSRLRAGQHQSCELLVKNKHGTSFFVFVTDTPVFDEQGKLKAIIGVSTDITDRKRVEQALRFLADSSATLASVVDYESTLMKVAGLAVPQFADWCAVDMVETDGSLRRLAVVHTDPAKVKVAHEFHRLYPPNPASHHGVPQVMRTGASEMMTDISDDMMVRGARNADHLRMLQELGLRSYMCVPLKGRARLLGVVSFVFAESGRRYSKDDLAFAEELARRAAIAIENAQLYAELRDADRRKDEFLATLAHELRNPLAPVRNSLQILKMPRVDAATTARTLEMMERQVQHLVRLVDDLLDVSRVMRGKIELRKERLELASVVARAVETAQPLIEAQGHELFITLPPESLRMDADPMRLAQVFGNLLTNAAKYTERNGRIWLTAHRESDQAVLSVRDNGIGIAPDMLPHIFELFVQVDHTATRSQGGLGIGLTLVKNLVEMHHGTVKAHSAGLGKGSEFVVQLPLASLERKVPEGSGDGEQRQVAPSSGHRLMVVDDNADAAHSLAMLLRLQGHAVQVAHDGPSALAMAKVDRPEMIFLDIGMPGMDGYEVARRLRQQPGLKKVVLAALTGWGQQEDRRRSAEAGFDHHLVKPTEPKALESLLADLKTRKSNGQEGHSA